MNRTIRLAQLVATAVFTFAAAPAAAHGFPRAPVYAPVPAPMYQPARLIQLENDVAYWRAQVEDARVRESWTYDRYARSNGWGHRRHALASYEQARAERINAEQQLGFAESRYQAALRPPPPPPRYAPMPRVGFAVRVAF